MYYSKLVVFGKKEVLKRIIINSKSHSYIKKKAQIALNSLLFLSLLKKTQKRTNEKKSTSSNTIYPIINNVL